MSHSVLTWEARLDSSPALYSLKNEAGRARIRAIVAACTDRFIRSLIRAISSDFHRAEQERRNADARHESRHGNEQLPACAAARPGRRAGCSAGASAGR